MARYHLSPKTGMPQKCSAAIACPYGSMLTHYDYKAQALKAQEKLNKLKFADGGLAQVHERQTSVPGRPGNVEQRVVIEEVKEAPKKEPKPLKMTKSIALDNARRARAEAGNERGAFIRAYLKKISVGEQLALFSSYGEEPARGVIERDEIPLENDLIVQEGIIYRVTGYSTLRNELHVQPLVATKGRDAIYPTGQVISNYVYATTSRSRILRQLTAEEIAERQALRKTFKAEAEETRKENLAALESAEVSTYDYLASPKITTEELTDLIKNQDQKMSKLNDELVYHRRISGMNFVDKAANKLASEGKLPPHHIAVLNSVGSSAYVVTSLRKELWDTPRALEHENKRIAEEFEKDPEEPEEPKAPGFWKKLFNGNAEEEHGEEVQEYQEEKTRKAELRDRFSKNTSLLVAYNAHSVGNPSHSQAAKLSYSYGAVAISSIRNIYNSEKILSMEDNVELKRILESHIPEALGVASDRNLDSSDQTRLNGALSGMLDRIEIIRKRSGTLSQMESKKAIEFLEVKFGDHS